MPMTSEWIEPEVFTAHKGVTIYHTYKDEEMEQGQNDYWFTTHANDCEPEFHFDVRELNVPARSKLDEHPPFICSTTDSPKEKKHKNRLWAQWHKRQPKIIRKIIRQAIEAGLLSQDQPYTAG